MKRRFRRGAAAALLLSLLPPFALHAAAGTAPLRTLGCAALGYTLRVPRTWQVSGGCASHAVVLSDDRSVRLRISVERHGFWSDARAISSISTDIARSDPGRGGRLLTPVKLWVRLLNGGRYMEGDALIRTGTGAALQVAEMETFARGHMYKFEALIGATGTRATVLRSIAVATVWSTIQIDGVQA